MQKPIFNEHALAESLYDESADEDVTSLDDELIDKYTKAGRLHARRSVDEYLESKRLRQRYNDLFDEYFGED